MLVLLGLYLVIVKDCLIRILLHIHILLIVHVFVVLTPNFLRLIYILIELRVNFIRIFLFSIWIRLAIFTFLALCFFRDFLIFLRQHRVLIEWNFLVFFFRLFVITLAVLIFFLLRSCSTLLHFFVLPSVFLLVSLILLFAITLSHMFVIFVLR